MSARSVLDVIVCWVMAAPLADWPCWLCGSVALWLIRSFARSGAHDAGARLPAAWRPLGNHSHRRRATAVGCAPMANVFTKWWRYMKAKLNSSFEERADPKIQLEQAITEAQDQ